MKIKEEKGTVLAVAILIAVILAGLGIALMLLLYNQSRATFFNRDTNAALMIADGGITKMVKKLENEPTTSNYCADSGTLAPGAYAVTATKIVTDLNRWKINSEGGVPNLAPSSVRKSIEAIYDVYIKQDEKAYEYTTFAASGESVWNPNKSGKSGTIWNKTNKNIGLGNQNVNSVVAKPETDKPAQILFAGTDAGLYKGIVTYPTNPDTGQLDYSTENVDAITVNWTQKWAGGKVNAVTYVREGQADRYLLMATQDNGVFKSENDGETWVAVNSAQYQSTWTRVTTDWGASSIDIGDGAKPAFSNKLYTADSRYSMIIGRNDGKLVGYKNTGTVSTSTWSADSYLWPTNKPGYQMPGDGHAKPSFWDMDSDGDSDIIIGAENGSSLAYRNDGWVSRFITTWTYQSAYNMPDIGDRARPAFANLDADTDFDAIVGRSDGKLVGYRNIGSDTTPNWSNDPYLWPTDKAGYQMPGDGNARPTLADLDNDGDRDIIIGAGNGSSLAYRNDGWVSRFITTWTYQSGQNMPDVDKAKPAFTDLDGDGDLDAVVGKSDGTSQAYKNTGSTATPAWNADNTYFPPGEDVGDRARPAFINFNGDAYTDIIIGSDDGYSRAYKNFGWMSLKTVSWNDLGWNSTFDTTGHGDGGSNWQARPALGDLDGDGDLDLMQGRKGSWLCTTFLHVHYRDCARVCCWRNIGTTASPVWERQSSWDLPSMNCNDHCDGANDVNPSSPTLGKFWNNDNKADLIVGYKDGTVYGFNNNSTGGYPNWKLKSGANFNPKSEYNYYLGDFGDESNPTLGDIDADGDQDLMIGRLGDPAPDIVAYRNNGNLTSPSWSAYTTWDLDGTSGNDDGPALGDLDGDGDADLMAGEEGGSVDNSYRNDFDIGGGWTRNTDWDIIGDIGSKTKPCLADLYDNDGDCDLWVGEDGGSNRMYQNTGSSQSQIRWIRWSAWDLGDVGEKASPAICNLDNDGLNDLMVGRNDNGTLGGNGSWSNFGPIAYEWTGAAWVRQAGWDLGVSQPGNRTCPTLFDMDGDGDMDMLVGIDDNDNIGGDDPDYTYGVENTGSVSSPSWGANTGWNIGDQGGHLPGPQLADLFSNAGSPIPDLMLGRDDGVSLCYKNNGTWTSTLTWTRNSGWDPGSVADDASPWLADFYDNDGDFDLVIGSYEYWGSDVMKFYKNTGTLSSPIWTYQTEWDPPDSQTSCPTLYDLDGDLDKDMLVGVDYDYLGVTYRAIYGYENTGSTSSPSWARNTSWDLGTGQFGDVAHPGPALAPLVHTLANNIPDLMVGRNDGVSVFFKNNGSWTSTLQWTRNSAWDPPSVGDDAAPALCNLDGDAYPDLMNGRWVSGLVGENQENKPLAYEWNGSSWQRNSDWDAPSSGTYYPGNASVPYLADWDNDGDMDMLIGNDDSNGLDEERVFGFENIGDANFPDWSRAESRDVDGTDLLGGGATRPGPALANLNNDADIDLMVGVENGTLKGFKWVTSPHNIDLSTLIINDVAGHKTTDVACIATSHGVFKTNNRGALWNASAQGWDLLNAYSVDIANTDANRIYAGVEHNGVCRSPNGGESWTKNTGANHNPIGWPPMYCKIKGVTQDPKVFSVSVDHNDRNTVYAGCEYDCYAEIRKTRDGADHWFPSVYHLLDTWYTGDVNETIQTIAIHSTQPGKVIAGGAGSQGNAGVMVTTTGGETYTLEKGWGPLNEGLASGINENVKSLLFDPGTSNASYMYLGSYGNGVYFGRQYGTGDTKIYPTFPEAPWINFDSLWFWEWDFCDIGRNDTASATPGTDPALSNTDEGYWRSYNDGFAMPWETREQALFCSGVENVPYSDGTYGPSNSNVQYDTLAISVPEITCDIGGITASKPHIVFYGKIHCNNNVFMAPHTGMTRISSTFPFFGDNPSYGGRLAVRDALCVTDNATLWQPAEVSCGTNATATPHGYAKRQVYQFETALFKWWITIIPLDWGWTYFREPGQLYSPYREAIIQHSANVWDAGADNYHPDDTTLIGDDKHTPSLQQDIPMPRPRSAEDFTRVKANMLANPSWGKVYDQSSCPGAVNGNLTIYGNQNKVEIGGANYTPLADDPFVRSSTIGAPYNNGAAVGYDLQLGSDDSLSRDYSGKVYFIDGDLNITGTDYGTSWFGFYVNPKSGRLLPGCGFRDVSHTTSDNCTTLIVNGNVNIRSMYFAHLHDHDTVADGSYNVQPFGIVAKGDIFINDCVVKTASEFTPKTVRQRTFMQASGVGTSLYGGRITLPLSRYSARTDVSCLAKETVKYRTVQGIWASLANVEQKIYYTDGRDFLPDLQWGATTPIAWYEK